MKLGPLNVWSFCDDSLSLFVLKGKWEIHRPAKLKWMSQPSFLSQTKAVFPLEK